MADIRPNQLPDADAFSGTDKIIVDQNANGVRKAEPGPFINFIAPIASQSEAETGADNTKRMTPLRTKQSIAAEVGVSLASVTQGNKADSAVQSVNGKTGTSVTLDKSDVGLGDADNTSDMDKPVSTATQAALNNKLDNTSPRLIPSGGNTDQVLVKSSDDDYDLKWETVAANSVWLGRAGIGGFYFIDTSLNGVDIPPSSIDGDTVWIQLTAGLTGAGQFNEGKLTSESVSGSAPDVLATAVVSVTGSPMNGQTIRLLNTECRIIRPYVTSGTVLGDAIRNITGTIDDVWSTMPTGNYGSFSVSIGTNANRPQPGASNTRKITIDASRQVPKSDENRMKMLGVTVYMRVK